MVTLDEGNANLMNEYIIFTTEGHTTAPNENLEIENCQVLGRARRNNPNEAKDNLQKDNPLIAEAGFDSSEFVVVQLLSDEERVAIKEVLDYLWDDEERHYEESGKPANHIFPVLKRLKAYI